MKKILLAAVAALALTTAACGDEVVRNETDTTIVTDMNAADLDTSVNQTFDDGTAK